MQGHDHGCGRTPGRLKRDAWVFVVAPKYAEGVPFDAPMFVTPLFASGVETIRFAPGKACGLLFLRKPGELGVPFGEFGGIRDHRIEVEPRLDFVGPDSMEKRGDVVSWTRDV